MILVTEHRIEAVECPAVDVYFYFPDNSITLLSNTSEGAMFRSFAISSKALSMAAYPQRFSHAAIKMGDRLMPAKQWMSTFPRRTAIAIANIMSSNC